MKAPGQHADYTYGGCDSKDKEPEGGQNMDCTGEHSAQAKKGIKEIKENGDMKIGTVNLDTILAINEAEGKPTCVLGYGSFDNVDYIVRDCVKVIEDYVGKCTTFPDQDFKDNKKIMGITLCGCNVDGCNGKEITANLTTTAAPPVTTGVPLTTDASRTTRIQVSSTTWILATIFLVYFKLVN
jgi:hypothetical protein